MTIEEQVEELYYVLEDVKTQREAEALVCAALRRARTQADALGYARGREEGEKALAFEKAMHEETKSNAIYWRTMLEQRGVDTGAPQLRALTAEPAKCACDGAGCFKCGDAL